MLMKFENALQQEMRTKSTYVSRFKKATKKLFYITFPFFNLCTSVLRFPRCLVFTCSHCYLKTGESNLCCKVDIIRCIL